MGRNQFRLVVDALGGQHGTRADNVIASGLFGRTSFSVGQSHFETDGIRANNDSNQNVYHAFVQGAVSHATNVQVELRRSDSDLGDLRMLFDPLNFFPLSRSVSDSTSIRLGGRQRFAPGAILMGSFIHRLLDSDFEPTPVFQTRTHEEANLGELRYLQRLPRVNLTVGAGKYQGDSDQTRVLRGTQLPPVASLIRHFNAYAYADVNLSDQLAVGIGMSYDEFESRAFKRHPANPKFGVTWLINSATTFRAAAFRSLQRTLISSQTIEPTQVAGFNQFFFDVNGAQSWRYALAVDRRLSQAMYSGIEVTFRDLTTPFTVPATGTISALETQESSARAYLYATPRRWLAVTTEYTFNHTLGDPAGNNVQLLARSTTHRIGGEARAFGNWGGYGRLKATFVDQEGRFNDRLLVPVVGVAPGADRFFVVEASSGYRLPRQRGVVAVEVQNVANAAFRFQDISISEPTLVSQRAATVRFTLAF